MSPLRSLIRKGKVVWDPKFTRRRSLNFKDLGKSYFDWHAELSAKMGGEDLATAQAALLDADFVPIFMRDDDDIEISPEAIKVEDFCFGIKPRFLDTEPCEGGLPAVPVALVHERTLDGGMVSRMDNQGPLTARQLCQALKERHIRSSEGQPSSEAEEVWEAQRRHIYVTDPDPWSICAIVRTALHYQRAAIRSVLYRHLQFDPRINVSIPPEGERFELSFHLPCMPMRDSGAPNIDARRIRNGATLRKYQDVSFLNLKDSHSPTYRYEAQISFVMTGQDDSTWDTYYFDDTYFDPIRDEKRWVEFYDESGVGADGTRLTTVDPATRGRSEPNPPILDPRQYFLLVLRYSLEHVKAEWEWNVDRVHDNVRDYPQTEQDLQGLSPMEWTTKVKDLSNTLWKGLSTEVEIIETFFVNHHTLFQTDLCDPLVSKIAEVLEELEYLKKKLERDVNECEALESKQVIGLNSTLR